MVEGRGCLLRCCTWTVQEGEGTEGSLRTASADGDGEGGHP